MDLEYTIGVQAEQAKSTLSSVERSFQDVDRAAVKLGSTVDNTSKTAASGSKTIAQAADGIVRSHTAAGTATETLASKFQRLSGTSGIVDTVKKSTEGFRATLEMAAGRAVQFIAAIGPVGLAVGAIAVAIAAVTIAVVAGAKVLAGWISEAQAAGDAAWSLSQKTNISVEALEGYKFIGAQAGVSLNTITGAIGTLEGALGSGSRRTKEALGAIGLGFDEIRRMKPEQAFDTVLAKLGDLPNASDQAAVGAALFGSRWRDVSALAKEDAGALLTDFKALGGGVSSELALAADRVGDAQGRIRTAFEATKLQIGGLFLPAMSYVAGAFADGWIDTVQRSGLSLTSFVGTVDTAAAAIIRGLGGLVYTVALVGDAFIEFASGRFIQSMGILHFLAEVIDKAGLAGQVMSALTFNPALGHLSELAQGAAEKLKSFSLGAAEAASTGAATLHNIAGGIQAFGVKLASTTSDTLGNLRKEIQAEAALAREESRRISDALVNLAGPRVKSALELATAQLKKLAGEVELAQRAGATSREVYEQLGGKLIKAGREADTFRINVEKISPALREAIDSAREFKIDEILARANQDMLKEFQRVLKVQTEERAKVREAEERAQVDANTRYLRNEEEAQDAIAQLVRDRAQGTMHEARAEADYKIYQLDRWRQKELQEIPASSKDYALLASQIEEIYQVRLAGVMEEYGRSHRTFWQRLKDGAGSIYEGLVGTASGHFASILTVTEHWRDGFKGIMESVRDTFTNILADMLDYYLKRFIARLVLGMGGGGGGITGAILNAAGLNVGGGGGGIVGGVAQQQGGNWLLSALGLGGGGAIGGATSLAGTAALMPALTSGGLGVAGAGLSSTSLAGMSGTMPALSSASGFGAGGAGLTTAGLLGGAAAGGAGLGLGYLGTKIFGGSGWAASGFGAGTGAATGALIGSVVPGIGTAVGAIVGGLAGMIGGWIGKSVGEKINDKRDDFLQQFGGAGTGEGSGFANVSAETARMDRLGMNGAETWRLIFQPKDWDDFNAGVKRLQAAFEDLRFVQDKVNESYALLQANGQKAMDQGASEIEVLKAQAGGYSEIYTTIMRTGAEAPAGFEAVAQKLLEQGLLVDETGRKFENLFGLYEANAKRTVADTQDVNGAFERLQGQQQELIDRGIAHEDVLRIQAGAYSELVNRIKEMGGTAPEAMRPVLQELTDMGLLVDAAGVKVTDLSGLFKDASQEGAGMGQTVQDAMAQATTGAEMTEAQMRDLKQSIDAANQEAKNGAGGWQMYRDRGVALIPDIKDALRSVGDAARDVVDDMERTFNEFQPRPVRLPVEWEMPEKAGIVAHSGGYVDYSGLKRFHAGGLNSDERLAVLQTHEGVLSRRGMANLGRLNSGAGMGGGDSIVIEKGAIVVKGVSDPEAVAEHIMDRLRRQIIVRKRRAA